MVTHEIASISISPELLAFAARLLVVGRHGDLSEVLRAALRQMEERELDSQIHRGGRAADPSAQVEHQARERAASNV